jgi:metal-responsive CopG/Arc/MetJ family transcriptional regulator
MKTAISLPEATFVRADAVARRLGLSRSELYVRALEAYLGPPTTKSPPRSMRSTTAATTTRRTR